MDSTWTPQLHVDSTQTLWGSVKSSREMVMLDEDE
jgi:hypothetical protein